VLFSWALAFADGLEFSETMKSYGNLNGIYKDMEVDLDIRIEDIALRKKDPSTVQTLLVH
jgi:hypothetical protein